MGFNSGFKGLKAQHVSSGTPLFITRPEESYRLCCVVVFDLETSRICAPYIYINDISSLKVNDLTLILLIMPANRRWDLIQRLKG